MPAKIKIGKRHLNEIKKIRAFVSESDQKQELMIANLARKIGLSTEDEIDTLWDFIMNNSTWMVEMPEEKNAQSKLS